MRRSSILSKNKIGGKEFMALTNDLREMFPVVGERVKVRKIINEFSDNSEKIMYSNEE